MKSASLRLLLVVLLLSSPALANDAVERIPLWPEGAPGAVGDEPADIPTLDIYLPDNADAATPAVVVCPGGGYAHLAMGHEGDDIGKRLSQMGVAVFVLRYRLAPRYREPIQLHDAQRALRHVRHHAERYNIDPDRLGILGFSAGGHLAASTATLIGEADPDADDPIDRHSARPDFAVLCYPVITMTDAAVTHAGSRSNLIGSGDAAKAEHYSLEKQVTERTPPTFLFHTDADTGVPPENSVLFYLALRKASIPAELHIYQPGRHGVGLAADHPALNTWPTLLENWLQSQNILTSR
ncbi:MAG: alpha/beta hydrolase [Phycisphaeraceae bacterium]